MVLRELARFVVPAILGIAIAPHSQLGIDALLAHDCLTNTAVTVHLIISGLSCIPAVIARHVVAPPSPPSARSSSM